VLVIEKKFYGLFVAAILLAGPLLGSVPAAFATPPTLEEKCAKQTNAKKSPDCELLQRLNDLEAELKAKDIELMEKDDLLMDKDTELMDKDMELMDKDMELMDKDMELMDDLSDLDIETTANFQAVGNALKGDETVCDESFKGDNTLCQRSEEFAGNYELLCNNVPFFRDAIGIVNTSVLAVLGVTNFVFDEVNDVFLEVKNFNFNVDINPPSFGVNPPEKCINILETEICINIPSFGVNPPSFGVNFGKLLSFIPDPIPFPTNIIGNVDTTLDEVGNCTII